MSETLSPKRGLLITMPAGERAVVPKHLVFPDWLFAESSLLASLFEDEETAKEAYVRYYTDANRDAQEEFGSMLTKTVDEACKEFQKNETGVYTREFQNSLRAAVMNAFIAWHSKYGNILDAAGLHDVFMYVNFPGVGYPNIIASQSVAMLVEGHVELNFLAVLNPKTCQRAFEMAAIAIAPAGLAVIRKFEEPEVKVEETQHAPV